MCYSSHLSCLWSKLFLSTFLFLSSSLFHFSLSLYTPSYHILLFDITSFLFHLLHILSFRLLFIVVQHFYSLYSFIFFFLHFFYFPSFSFTHTFPLFTFSVFLPFWNSSFLFLFLFPMNIFILLLLLVLSFNSFPPYHFPLSPLFLFLKSLPP